MNKLTNQATPNEASPDLSDCARTSAMVEFDRLCLMGADKSQRLEALTDAMQATPHGAASDSLAHGEDTWLHYSKLCDTLVSTSSPAEDWWPSWLVEHGRRLLELQEARATMKTYLTYHDCGKAWSLSKDASGRIHYPDHAERSAEVWGRAGGSATECALMQNDMVLHTICAEDAAEFAQNPLAPSLLLAAFAELQSNAQSIFGGRGSTSYKIKIKALNRRANAICRTLFTA